MHRPTVLLDRIDDSVMVWCQRSNGCCVIVAMCFSKIRKMMKDGSLRKANHCKMHPSGTLLSYRTMPRLIERERRDILYVSRRL
jgi:hypothetical protein